MDLRRSLFALVAVGMASLVFACSGDSSDVKPEPSLVTTACTKNADCSDVQFCLDSVCTQLTGCENDEGCSEGEICAVSDDSDGADCGALTFCAITDATINKDGVTGTCLNFCTGDSDCSEGWICAEGLCVVPDPECTTDADCGEGSACTPEGTCQVLPDPGIGPTPPECTIDADCTSGYACVAQACVAIDSPAPIAHACPFGEDSTGDCACPSGGYTWDAANATCKGTFPTWEASLAIVHIGGTGDVDEVSISVAYDTPWRTHLISSNEACGEGNWYDVVTNACVSTAGLASSCQNYLNSTGICTHLNAWPESNRDAWWIAPSAVCGPDALFNATFYSADPNTMVGNCVTCNSMYPIYASVPTPAECRSR